MVDINAEAVNCYFFRVLNRQEADQLEVFNEKKEEVLMTLESVDDIFNYADQLKATLSLLTFDQESTAKE